MNSITFVMSRSSMSVFNFIEFLCNSIFFLRIIIQYVVINITMIFIFIKIFNKYIIRNYLWKYYVNYI